MKITMDTRTLLGFAVITAGAIALGAPSASHAADDTPAPTAHPRYDDGGTLDWRTKWADAAQIAKERRRLIFVEWGRES